MVKHFARWRAGLLLALLGMGLLNGGGGALAAPPPEVGTPPGKVAPLLPRSNRIPWQAGNYYLTGVNYPFFRSYGADIATMSTRDLSCEWLDYNAFDYAAIDRDFAEMSANGVRVVRWFLFGDGRGGRFDNHNYMTALDATFFSHMDQVLQIAARHNIYLIWSVWDFLMLKPARWLPECSGQGMQAILDALAKMPPELRGPYEQRLRLALYKNPWNEDGSLKPLLPGTGTMQPDVGLFCPRYAGGHRNLITDVAPDGAQDRFFQDVLRPLLQRYGTNPQIVGWEAMNEPEWGLSDGTGQNPNWDLEPVTLAQMRAFVGRFAAQVHADAPGAYATLGSASLKWSGGEPYLNNANLWQGLGLDYYQIHFYGWMSSAGNNYSPMTRDYYADPTLVAPLDAPAIVGEFPANGGQPAIYLPLVRQVSGGEQSILHLRALCQNQPQNPGCTVPITATLSYYSPAGDVQATQQVVMPASGAWINNVPPLPAPWTGAVRIEATGGVAATVEQTGVAALPDRLDYPSQETGNTSLFVPHVVNLSNGHRTRLALQNTDVRPADVTMTYYNTNGSVALSSNFVLAPRGMALIPDLIKALPPPDFTGSLAVQSNRPLVGVAEEIDPLQGVAAVAMRPETYAYSEAIPDVRNDGSPNSLFLDILNARDAAVTGQVQFYAEDGTPQAPLNFNLGPRAQQSLDLSFLPPSGRFSVVINANQTVLTQVRRADTVAHVLAVHSGRVYGAEFFQFPAVYKNAAGWSSTLTALNLSASQTVTFNVTINDPAGGATTRAVPVAPRTQWSLDMDSLPELPNGFNGTAQVAWYWPWQTGWNEGFPLLAVERNRTATGNGQEEQNGIVSTLLTWSVTGLTPREMLDRSFANNWAGGLAWSYADTGTGGWADYLTAQAGFSAAHPAEVNIQRLTPPSPTPTAGNPATATAQAGTPTPSYGNGATATAVAGGPTPGPPCCTGEFVDVPPDAYFAPAVRYLNCGGFVSGYGCGGPGEPCPGSYYRPGNTTTRGQFSKILVLGRGWPIQNAAPDYTFADVLPNNPFYLYIETAARRGIISGYQCGGPGEPCDGQNRPYFRSSAPITRGQLSKLIVLGMGWAVQAPADPAYTFADVPRTQPFFGFIETIIAHRVASGYGCGGPGEPCDPDNHGYFRPGAYGTRGQLSKMLFNALSYP